MSNKKNIERLFQEKFKDFEVEPPTRVWNNIESELKSNKPKIIPLWWKLSGIVAALIIGTFISYSILNDNKNNIPNQESQDNVVEKNNVNENANDTKTTIESPFKNQNSKVVENNNSIENKENLKSNIKNSQKTIKTASSDAVVAAPKNSIQESSLESKNNFGTTKNKIIASNKNYTKQLRSRKKQYNTSNGEINVVSDNNINTILERNDDIKNAVVLSEKNNSTENTKGTIDNPIIEPKEGIQNQSTVISHNAPAKKDSLTSPANNAFVSNELEEILKQKEAKIASNTPIKKWQRWQISSNASPVYYNSVSQGSPLDADFENNEKEYKSNLGYGIGLKYALNKKLSLKTGANAVAMEYNTNNIIFYQAPEVKSITNLSENLPGTFLQVYPNRSFSGNDEGVFDGKISQKTSYLEVPVELSYKILDKKFGVALIGGFSTLFLNENKVSLLSSGLNLNIGEANNLRQIHYSTNIGLGFKYSFWKSLQANFEPMFKYQINTFSSNSGNFKPYVLGLYTGISYSF